MLAKLRLKDFRNFSDRVIEFSPKTSVVLGANATGKTNILEAINLLATGKSFKANKNEEMIAYDEQIARVKGKLDNDILEVILTRGVITQGNVTKKTAKKRLLVNDAGKRITDFASHFQTVVFRPQDMDLVTQSPSIRRKFLDNVLSLSDREYYRSLLAYEKGLTRRNKFLIKIREEEIDPKVLTFWDNLLIKNGEYISRTRADFISFVNLSDQFDEKELQLEYDSSAVTEARFEQYRQAEVASGTTLVGPHRDDIIFRLDGRELDAYGSRGEQRMGVLWVKLAELDYLEEKKDARPTLLLDDIFSELDHRHRELIEQVLPKQQTIITAADPHYVEGLSDVEIIGL